MNLSQFNDKLQKLPESLKRDSYLFMGELDRFRTLISYIMGEFWIEFDYPRPLNLKMDMSEFIKKYPDSFYTYLTCKNKENIENQCIYINDAEGFAALVHPTYAGFSLKSTDNLPALLKFIEDNFTENKANLVPKIGLLGYSNGRYNIEYKEINSVVDIDWETNYNEDFKIVHDNLYKNVTTLTKSLHILHGKPGTGKTTYLRYLISLFASGKNQMVYLPSNLTYILSNPDFISSIGILKNKILIVEDAEEVLVSGDKRSLAISNILNISDGILGDIYQLHMIFTFNTNISKIDPAILRKGRLNFKYEFTDLEESKAKALCKKLNIEYKGYKTLSDIYNSLENGGASKTKSSIGFLAV